MNNPHLETSTQYFGCSLEDASHVVLLIHGRGQDPFFMQEMIVNRLSLDKVHYVAPGAANNTWYPMGFMAEFEENEPWFSYTMDCVDSAVTRLEELGWPPEKIILAGFSQGACVVCEYLSRRPRRYRGVAALTGGLAGPPQTSWAGESLDNTPVLLASSDIDEWVPISRVKETAIVLEERNAVVDLRIYEGMEHTINDEEIELLRKMILNI